MTIFHFWCLVIPYKTRWPVTCLRQLGRTYVLRTYTRVLPTILEYVRTYVPNRVRTRILEYWYVLEYSRRTRVRTQVRTRRATFVSWEENMLHYLINCCVFTVLIENRNFLKWPFFIFGALLFHIKLHVFVTFRPCYSIWFLWHFALVIPYGFCDTIWRYFYL